MRNEIECFYEQIQNIEYEDPERYLTASQDDGHRDGINNSQEKMDEVSIKSIEPSAAPSNDEPLISENVFLRKSIKQWSRRNRWSLPQSDYMIGFTYINFILFAGLHIFLNEMTTKGQLTCTFFNLIYTVKLQA